MVSSFRYGRQQTTYESSEIDAGLVGHVHLNKVWKPIMQTIQHWGISYVNTFVVIIGDQYFIPAHSSSSKNGNVPDTKKNGILSMNIPEHPENMET